MSASVCAFADLAQNRCNKKMLKQTRITKINTAIEQNVEPHRSRNDSLVLRLGEKSFVRLQNGNKLTPAGKYYYEQTKTQNIRRSKTAREKTIRS